MLVGNQVPAIVRAYTQPPPSIVVSAEQSRFQMSLKAPWKKTIPPPPPRCRVGGGSRVAYLLVGEEGGGGGRSFRVEQVPPTVQARWSGFISPKFRAKMGPLGDSLQRAAHKTDDALG